MVKVVAWYDNEWGYLEPLRGPRRQVLEALVRCAEAADDLEARRQAKRRPRPGGLQRPLDEDRKITDDARIRAALPTLE